MNIYRKLVNVIIWYWIIAFVGMAFSLWVMVVIHGVKVILGVK